MTDYTRVPVPYMTGGVRRYVEQGVPPGGFLTALLSNDLMGAVGRADEANQRRIVEWATFVHNCLPHNCHGSREAVRRWIGHGGLSGLALAQQESVGHAEEAEQ